MERDLEVVGMMYERRVEEKKKMSCDQDQEGEEDGFWGKW